MPPDEPQLICADEREAIRDAFKFRDDDCRDFVFLAELRQYFEEQAWFICLEELGLEGPLEDPGEEHAGCVEAYLEFFDTFDDVQLSEVCQEAATEALERAGEAYWECIHKFNEGLADF
jgi:hypothetical protein